MISSISMIITLESFFFMGNVFWYISKLKKEIDFMKFGLKDFRIINKININKKIK